MLLCALGLVREVFHSPEVPAHFDPIGFDAFHGWDCVVEEWIPVAVKDTDDMRDASIYRITDASGEVLERMTRLQAGGKVYYEVDLKAGVRDASSVNFTGTIVFRQNASSNWLGFILEPMRVSLRYFRGKLVESNTTRSDL